MSVEGLMQIKNIQLYKLTTPHNGYINFAHLISTFHRDCFPAVRYAFHVYSFCLVYHVPNVTHEITLALQTGTSNVPEVVQKYIHPLIIRTAARNRKKLFEFSKCSNCRTTTNSRDRNIFPKLRISELKCHSN